MTIALSKFPADRNTPRSARVSVLPAVVWLYLILVIVPIGMQLGPLLLTGLRICLICLTLPILLRLCAGAFGKILPTDVLFLCHLIWATVALLVNNPEAVIQQTGSSGVEFLGGYAIGRAYIRTSTAFLALAKALVALVCVMVPFAVFEAITGRALWIEMLQSIPGMRTVTDARATARSLFGITLERVQLGFAHPIHFGLFCAVTFSMCVVALKGTFGHYRRIATGVLLAATTCLALSSGALIALAFQIGLITWGTVFAQIRHKWWVLIALSACCYGVIDLLSNRTPLQVFMSYATFSAQTAYWRATTFEWGMASVWAHPFFGVGLNDWQRPEFMKSDSVDNFWLLMAMRYGIPGFAFLLAGYLWLLWRVMGVDLCGRSDLAQLRNAWVYTCLGLSFTLCTVHVWTAIFSFTFFLIGAGAWFLAEHTQDEIDLPAPPPEKLAPPFARPLANQTEDRERSLARSHRFTRF